MSATPQASKAPKVAKKSIRPADIPLYAILVFLTVVFLGPIFFIVFNSFKSKFAISSDPFSIPVGEMWAGFENYAVGLMREGFLWAVIYHHDFVGDSHRVFLGAYRVLHHACENLVDVHAVLLVRVFHGHSVPDGHVPHCENRGYVALDQSGGHRGVVHGVWCWPVGVHVCWFCEEHPARN